MGFSCPQKEVNRIATPRDDGQTAAKTPRRTSQPAKTIKDEYGLTALERGVADAFRLTRNATAAYLQVHPKATNGTARHEGPDILSRAHVKTYLEIRWKQQGMSADEAIAHLVMMARGIPDEVLNKDGTINVTKFKKFGLAGLVTGTSKTANGVTIKLESRLQALKLILEMAGKIAPESTKAALEAIAKAIEGTP